MREGRHSFYRSSPPGMGESAAFLVLLAASTFLTAAAELFCYECSVPRHKDGEKQDLRCVYEPWNLTGSVKSCLPYQKACKSERIDYKDSGVIQYFARSCSRAGTDSVVERQNMIVYTRYCFTSKCNMGDAIHGEGEETDRRIVAILVADVDAGGRRASAPPSLPFLLLALLSAAILPPRFSR